MPLILLSRNSSQHSVTAAPVAARFSRLLTCRLFHIIRAPTAALNDVLCSPSVYHSDSFLHAMLLRGSLLSARRVTVAPALAQLGSSDLAFAVVCCLQLPRRSVVRPRLSAALSLLSALVSPPPPLRFRPSAVSLSLVPSPLLSPMVGSASSESALRVCLPCGPLPVAAGEELRRSHRGARSALVRCSLGRLVLCVALCLVLSSVSWSGRLFASAAAPDCALLSGYTPDRTVPAWAPLPRTAMAFLNTTHYNLASCQFSFGAHEAAYAPFQTCYHQSRVAVHTCPRHCLRAYHDDPAGSHVYGSYPYHARSSICLAAIHSGVISSEDGGALFVDRFWPEDWSGSEDTQTIFPRGSHLGSDSNGVQSERVPQLWNPVPSLLSNYSWTVRSRGVIASQRQFAPFSPRAGHVHTTLTLMAGTATGGGVSGEQPLNWMWPRYVHVIIGGMVESNSTSTNRSGTTITRSMSVEAGEQSAWTSSSSSYSYTNVWRQWHHTN